jgi:hypothetical protein
MLVLLACAPSTTTSSDDTADSGSASWPPSTTTDTGRGTAFGSPAEDEADAFVWNGAYDNVGTSLAAGVDADGVPWLGIAGRFGAGLEGLPSDGVPDAWVAGDFDYVSWSVVVTNWDTPLVGYDGLSQLGAWSATGTLAADAPDHALPEASYGSLAAADLDGDGTDELALTLTGEAVAVYGSPDTWPEPRLTVSDAGFGQSYRSRVALADVDADGAPEILAQDDNSRTLWVLPGDAVGDYVPADLGVAVTDPDPERPLGLVSVGDLTGDGAPDVVCGGVDTPDEWTGRAYLLAGPVAGAVTTADAVATWVSGFPHDVFPSGIAVVPDQDGDGADEVALGSGDAWLAVFAGGTTGTRQLADAALVLVSTDRYDGLGVAMVPVDYDLDGLVDLAVGVPGATLGGESPDVSWEETHLESGAVYLFRAPLF